jgi:hypothetical protein
MLRKEGSAGPLYPYPMMLCIVYGVLNHLLQGYIPSKTVICGEITMPLRKSDPINVEFEARAKNLLKGQLKTKGITYAQLAEKLAEIGIEENERNLNNKISRGGFSAAFLLQCLVAIGSDHLRLD